MKEPAMLHRVVPFILLLFLLPACGCASTGGALVLTEDAMHDGLAAADDQVRTVCGSVLGSALKPACDDVRRTLITAFDAEIAFNRCIRNELQGNCLTPLITSIEALVVQVKKLPESESGRIVEQLARAVAAAVGRIR